LSGHLATWPPGQPQAQAQAKRLRTLRRVAMAVLAPAATAKLPADSSELAVAGCGAACPGFVLIPNPGPTVIGSGAEAIAARFDYRFAMAKTAFTLGQYKAF
jgi:hypothetical protein